MKLFKGLIELERAARGRGNKTVCANDPPTQSAGMILRAITTRLLDRHVATRLARLIPHPGVRLVATVATSFIIPLVVEQVLTRSAGVIARRATRALSTRAA